MEISSSLERIFNKLDEIGTTTTETKTKVETLIGPEGRVPKLESNVRELDQFKWKVTAVGGAAWALIELAAHWLK
jgi:hypothetical protein